MVPRPTEWHISSERLADPGSVPRTHFHTCRRIGIAVEPLANQRLSRHKGVGDRSRLGRRLRCLASEDSRICWFLRDPCSVIQSLNKCGSVYVAPINKSTNVNVAPICPCSVLFLSILMNSPPFEETLLASKGCRKGAWHHYVRMVTRSCVPGVKTG